MTKRVASLSVRRRSLFGFAARLRLLSKDQSGTGAIEFAVLLPILIALYFGAVEFGDAFTAKRKVTGAASAVGDLVTRSKELSKPAMADILEGAPNAVLYPYPVDKTNTEVKVTCAAIDKDKIATVKWSVAFDGGVTDRVGSRIALPAGVVLPESKLVAVDMVYKYKPVLGAYIVGDTVDFTSKFYFKPRVSGTVCYDGVCC